ncbi:MAG TPA: bifunctional phosphopantothenoylcysteine decarboxylase/phosphopantothenate--cysteine ligase CoaBC [Nitrospirota bacterium]|nr:bifunctional phosphopantothenoylcysteine decarboxylase/phosphopantothenate--cysteine ligase CoaBC [Nitrospirota bacterium]
MEPRTRLEGKRILLGVSGSIAAYKAVELLRRLREQGADVRVVLTRNAERFVTSLTFETLSGNPVPGAEFQDREQPGIGHIDLTSGLDLAVIAPATANVIGKVASGIADDTLTTALTAVECPVVMAPAMNDRMYRNAVVRRNIALLRAQGIRFVEPGTGELACGTVGQGRLADVDLILREIAAALPPGDLAGIKIVVTAGPTRERIDAVRFISNPSTGRMGFALAAAAYGRGADVVLISGPTEVIPPRGPVLIRVTSAADMLQAVLEHRTRADVLIMAAAVSDFKPARSSERKIKKQEAATMLELARTEDILATVGRLPGRPLLVGFAAETDDLLDNAQKKMKEKDIDLIVANDLSKQGAGFAVDTNSVTLIERSGGMTEIPLMPKAEIAARIMDKIVELKKR